ncbi:hypothetical protein [Limnoglobus roseus]|uniref:Uncharacterized protein n=1 Tax=Limnoglobus roseus TaxID=2598579 RepID=A0A5C1AIN4_9BACT|nr:hypothetical protein [Limnoglobus roseus]QEL19299.1 hypothetical protein PX52LOC_06364 [Limnoglobus roseus]
MTPARFCTLAAVIAGRFWRTQLPPLIGKGRWMVRTYASGERPIPETVAKLMEMLASQSND